MLCYESFEQFLQKPGLGSFGKNAFSALFSIPSNDQKFGPVQQQARAFA